MSFLHFNTCWYLIPSFCGPHSVEGFPLFKSANLPKVSFTFWLPVFCLVLLSAMDAGTNQSLLTMSILSVMTPFIRTMSALQNWLENLLVLLQPGWPGLYRILQMRPDILFVQPSENVLISEVEGPGNLAQDRVGRLGRLSSLSAHRQLVGHNDAQIFFLLEVW